MAQPSDHAAPVESTTTNPWAWITSAFDYTLDAWERTILYADVQRQRGDQYRQHLQETAPNVLHFQGDLVLSGLTLPKPVNYGLVRITPLSDTPVDPSRRPIVVVDPRAGHGPGIGGFKPDSEIGAALHAGHPCYFVGFLPDPVPGQTIDDVLHAMAAFMQYVNDAHPESQGKPAVIGNCQAGWQILMAAAVWPDLFGPIIAAGSPLSYWAGSTPMRYTGGLLGGSWMTAMVSDLGDGLFDGAWLVKNFEDLNPANTLWTKNYNLYSKVDTEAPRYLGFEKYWGGHVYLNADEIQYIVDNLFVGNRLSSAQLITSEGIRIDFRNIRSPIVVFCSYGDNITPPEQALGWITDLYRDESEIVSHDQTIIYATHDSIGHLGIFVSGSVGRKEHREFVSNIDMIDLIPAGLYHATVKEEPASEHCEGSDDPYTLSIQRQSYDVLRNLVKPDPESDRRFATVSRVSEINLSLYRSLMQPWVRALSTPTTANWLKTIQPLRLSYESWSSQNVLAPLVQHEADTIRENRHPVSDDNPWWKWQTSLSDMITNALDSYRDQRDSTYAAMFNAIYGAPFVQALAGFAPHDGKPAREHPGESPEHKAFVRQHLAELHTKIHQGGVIEATIRCIFYVLRMRGHADKRQFRDALCVHQPNYRQCYDHASFREMVREQALILTSFPDETLRALPGLLAGKPAAELQHAADLIRELAGRDPLDHQEQSKLDAVLRVYEQAIAASATQPQLLLRPLAFIPVHNRSAATPSSALPVECEHVAEADHGAGQATTSSDTQAVVSTEIPSEEPVVHAFAQNEPETSGGGVARDVSDPSTTVPVAEQTESAVPVEGGAEPGVAVVAETVSEPVVPAPMGTETESAAVMPTEAVSQPATSVTPSSSAVRTPRKHRAARTPKGKTT